MLNHCSHDKESIVSRWNIRAVSEISSQGLLQGAEHGLRGTRMLLVVRSLEEQFLVTLVSV